MKIYNKEFNYKNFKFNIKLEVLDINVIYLTINDTGYSNFYLRKLINIETIELSILEFEQRAKDFVNSRISTITTPLELKILELGFST